MTNSEKAALSRRTFVKGSALAGLGAAAMGSTSLFGCAPQGQGDAEGADLAATGSFLISWPSMRIRPSVKSITPATARRVVVLPAPLWPMKPYISPGSTWRDRSSTALCPPG